MTEAPLPKLLYVEGDDDLHVLTQLLGAWSIQKAFDVKPTFGIEPMRRTLKTTLKADGVTHLGAILDTDNNLEARWRSLRDSLAASVTLPERPDPGGTIVTSESGIRFGLWLMPDNLAAGMLEDFLIRLVPEADWMMPHALCTVDGLPEGSGRFKSIHRTKAVIHTWLAWQEEPGKPFGLALKNRSLTPGAGDACRLMGWVSRLFELSDPSLPGPPLSI